jgi:integrase
MRVVAVVLLHQKPLKTIRLHSPLLQICYKAMASIIKVGKRWRAQIRRKGHETQTETFSTKVLAEAWARGIEGDIESLRAGVMPMGKLHTVGKLVEKYEADIGAAKPFGRNKADVLKKIKEHLKDVQIAALTPARIVSYITEDRRIKDVTAGIDLTYLKSVLKVARALWQLPVNPSVVDDARETLHHMGMLNRGQERDRRPTTAEIDNIKVWLLEHSVAITPDHLDFILDSGFRPPSEIAGLRWDKLNRKDRTITILDRKDPKRKIGNNQIVPLLGRCMEIIDRQPKVGPFIFAINEGTWSSIFPRACAACGIVDLRLYDLRHESISRLVEGNKFSIPELMLITGHKDPKQLMRYTQLRAVNLHDR